MLDTSDKIYPVATWCDEADISRPFFYKLKNQGKGPETKKVGRRTFVMESPREWAQRVGEDAA